MSQWIQNRSGVLVPIREAGFIQPGIGLMNKKQGGSGGDPYWDSVVSLLHFDGVNGGTNFIDERGKIWTATAAAKLDTSIKKFGMSSLYLSGINDSISTPAVADFNFGTSDFTAELFVAPSNVSALRMLLGQFNSSTYAPFRLELNSGNYNVLIRDTLVNTWVGGTATFSAPASGVGIFDHVALVRSGSAFMLFVNGILKGTRTVASALASVVDPMMVGKLDGLTNYTFAGHVDEMRITGGIARYTSNFTPPVAPFPNHS